MNLSTRVRSLSDFKANAAEILLDLEKRGEPLVITQNGQAKAILQDGRAWGARRGSTLRAKQPGRPLA